MRTPDTYAKTGGAVVLAPQSRGEPARRSAADQTEDSGDIRTSAVSGARDRRTERVAPLHPDVLGPERQTEHPGARARHQAAVIADDPVAGAVIRKTVDPIGDPALAGRRPGSGPTTHAGRIAGAGPAVGGVIPEQHDPPETGGAVIADRSPGLRGRLITGGDTGAVGSSRRQRIAISQSGAPNHCHRRRPERLGEDAPPADGAPRTRCRRRRGTLRWARWARWARATLQTVPKLRVVPDEPVTDRSQLLHLSCQYLDPDRSCFAHRNLQDK